MMRKLVSIAAGLALATTVFAAVPASADQAVVTHAGGVCGMVGADKDGNFIFGGYGTVTHMVVNDNYAIMRCQASGITNDSGSTQRFTGFPCGVRGMDGWAYDSHATITKNGNASLTCKMPVGR
jgi:hypothetical protein